MTEKVIPTHNATRWNSHYDQAVVIRQYKFVVQQLCTTLASEGKVDVEYTDADWANTDAVIEVLALFAKATKVMQGDNFITNSMMALLASQLHLLCATKASAMDLPPYVRDAADAMFDDVEDRFYPPTNCAMIAAVLDPRVKSLTWCTENEKAKYRKLTVEQMINVSTVRSTGLGPTGGGSAGGGSGAGEN